MEIEVNIKVNGIDVLLKFNIDTDTIDDAIQKAVNIINEEYLTNTHLKLTSKDITKYKVCTY